VPDCVLAMNREDIEDSNVVQLPVTETLGVSFSGMPARIRAVSDTSPVAGQVSVGQIVRRLVVTGRIDMSGLVSGPQLAAVLEKYTSAEDSRHLYLTRDVTRAARQTRIVLTLDEGTLGITFSGSPPVIASIHQDSPYYHILRSGLEIDSLRIGDEFENSDMTSWQLGAMLAQYSGRTDRVLSMRKRSTRPTQSRTRELGSGVAVQQAERPTMEEVWRLSHDTQSMYTCRATRKPWERARFGSHIVLFVTMVVSVISLFAVCSRSTSESNCYLVLLFPTFVATALSSLMVNLSWRYRRMGRYCSVMQVALNLLVVGVVITVLVVADCGVTGEWCAAVRGLTAAIGSIVFIVINIPSFYSKAMEADLYHDGDTVAETEAGSDDCGSSDETIAR
jgi:hypothetical protein